MNRYKVYDREDQFIRRVFADTPEKALAKAKELQGRSKQKVWYVVHEPMAEITRGD